MKAETLTLLLVNLAGIMEKADESLLPGVYKEVGESLHTDPTGLGSLTLYRSIVQSLCYPLATYLSVHHNRARVIAFGAFLWASATFLVAFSSTYFQVAVSRGLNGIGLAIVAPAIQSLVADSTNDNNRGRAFGWLFVASNIGSVVGGLTSLWIAPITFLGIPGWRIAFHFVGLISVIVGILVYLFANDPHFLNGVKINPDPERSLWSEVKDLAAEAKSVMKIQSFQVIVAQGISNQFAWCALSFAPMWLELTGFTHEETAVLLICFVVASALGGLFAGIAGDVLSVRLPDTGRIMLSQISTASGIPLAAILLLGLPKNPSAMFWYGVVLFSSGFFISWNGPATNSPIFAEIVHEEMRTSVYALDKSFESVLSSFAPPIVGILAQHVYGYEPVVQDSNGIETDRVNAASLGDALFSAIGVPLALCCFIYSFLYHTYPRDRERAHMEALIGSEMRLIHDLDGSPSHQYSQLNPFGNKEVNLDDRTVIEIEYGEQGLDFEENEEKTLIRR